ncbi:Delphilin [Desmophyllum pertusum]|uniref:Delphilin n=1 Tax=Desmophyllum pertusum TaxID=174260 RepID=A0A9W9ZIP0_9CNID|nr:Delphilin [Desmophyllum pertusum]
MGGPGNLAGQMQLKRVNWEKLSIAGLEDTVWAQLGHNEPSEEVIEFIQLEQSFSAIQKASSKEEKKPEKPAVMNPKKTYNIAILLGHLKMPFEEIKQALLSMDEKKFSESHLKQLLLYAPDSKELQKFKYFADDVSKLDKADRFCYEMSKVSWYTKRLKALLFKARFADKVEEIKPDLESVLDASEELRKSPKLQKILELVLAMGNYMNKGNTRIASAAAFKIEYLNKLRNTKTSDNKSTLLHFLVQSIESKCPEVLNIKEELSSVPTAAKVSGQMVACEVEDLSTGMKELKSDLGAFRSIKSQDPNDRFSLAVKNIIDDTEGELNDLLTLQEKSKSEFRETVKFFGEKPTSATTEDFFGIFAAFLMNFVKAHTENLSKLKLKEEQAKREKQREERDKQRKTSKEQSMSDPEFDPKDELKKSFDEIKLKKRLHSQNSEPDVFTPTLSPRGSSNDTEAKPVQPQPDKMPDWTVVDVSLNSSPPPPKQEVVKIVPERVKPPVPTKPKPAPPPKTKPKSPNFDRSKEFSVPKSAGTITVSNVKPSKVAPPKRVSDYEEIGLSRTDGKNSKEEIPKLELKNDEAESKPSSSPNGNGVKSMMSMFEGAGKEIPTYAKPDMSQKKPKPSFNTITIEKKGRTL